MPLSHNWQYNNKCKTKTKTQIRVFHILEPTRWPATKTMCWNQETGIIVFQMIGCDKVNAKSSGPCPLCSSNCLETCATDSKNIARIANAVHVTLHSRIPMNVEIVVLNCQKGCSLREEDREVGIFSVGCEGLGHRFQKIYHVPWSTDSL